MTSELNRYKRQSKQLLQIYGLTGQEILTNPKTKATKKAKSWAKYAARKLIVCKRQELFEMLKEVEQQTQPLFLLPKQANLNNITIV